MPSSACRRPPCSTLFPYTTLFRSEVPVPPAVDRYEKWQVAAADRVRGEGRADNLARLAGIDGEVRLGVPVRFAAERIGNHVHDGDRSEEHTSELQSLRHLVCRLLLAVAHRALRSFPTRRSSDLRSQCRPPSIDMKSGKLLLPIGSGVKAEPTISLGLPGLTERFGSASRFVSPLRELGIMFTTVTDRKSTRLNSSHLGISYAVFCLPSPTVLYALSLHDALPI